MKKNIRNNGEIFEPRIPNIPKKQQQTKDWWIIYFEFLSFFFFCIFDLWVFLEVLHKMDFLNAFIYFILIWKWNLILILLSGLWFGEEADFVVFSRLFGAEFWRNFQRHHFLKWTQRLFFQFNSGNPWNSFPWVDHNSKNSGPFYASKNKIFSQNSRD